MPGPFHVLAFLGSFLLFSSELLTAKLLLPFFGGSAQVWTGSMMFFQGALLLGYLYGHLGGARLSPRRQAWLHLGVLAAASLAFLADPRPRPDAHPLGTLLLSLAAAIGAPFAALSATVPILQRWLEASDRPEKESPYSLYAASNAGSLAGLLSYPFLIEPFVPLDLQSRAWQVCYGLFVLGHLLVLPSASRPESAASVQAHDPAPAGSGRRLLAWIALAAGPCAAMLACTQYLSSSLTAVPLLWMLPLGIYLVTFILNFKAKPWRPFGCVLFLVAGLGLAPLFLAAVGRRVLTGGAMALAGAVSVIALVLNIAALFIIAMICHRSLAEDKPTEPGASSLFYLALSVGGLAGGALLAVAVPWLGRHSGLMGLDWLAAGALSLAALVLRDWELWRSKSVLRPSTLMGGFLVIVVFFFTARASLWEGTFALRNFYGTYRVVEDGRMRMLMHGNTLHGMQSRDETRTREPIAYYHRLGPVGDVFELLGAGFADVGVVGLGAGSLSAYGRPGTRMTFYELDPDVPPIAREHFTFLAETRASVDVVLGDARLSLQSSEARHDLLVIDAFSAGAIPTHLLTREAFELYRRRLSPGGVILVQVSNKHIDLRPMLAAQARALGLRGLIRHAVPPPGMGREYYVCQWAALSEDAAKLRRLSDTKRWEDLSAWSSRLAGAWTDRHSSLLPLIRF
ncbi:MAG: fused MFS/spermidine synthase [Elusimicrobia bacterium]|nr:fused MFS/spermidine synthase [Elusimicrobiota bacterium]